jgi:hypothetical protein
MLRHRIEISPTSFYESFPQDTAICQVQAFKRCHFPAFDYFPVLIV